MHCKYEIDGKTVYAMTDLSAEEVAKNLPGVSNVVVQKDPFKEVEAARKVNQDASSARSAAIAAIKAKGFNSIEEAVASLLA